VSDTPKPDQRPGGLVIDFGPVLAFEAVLGQLEAAWANVPAGTREHITRMVWLHPNGSVGYYRPPVPEDEEPTSDTSKSRGS
jgi:hypothetical protein